MIHNKEAVKWVEDMVALCKPDHVVWVDGSEAEKERLTAEAVSTGEVMELNQEKMPGCIFHRTAENDVARTEHLTFICTRKQEDAGPTNNWMHPDEAYSKVGAMFDGCMRGRTMYVIPFIMGTAGSPFRKIGIELTDSIYVVLNMRIMTRMGKVAADDLGEEEDFTRCLHSKGELDIDRRYILHFPEDNTIWSYGSGYGGNVLLGKKCLSLRIASYMGLHEGWMAEHMLIVGIQSPDGEITYIAGAFPSACGKTNLAMLIPPESMPGYKVWTVGDDIAWIRIGPDGRLWAVNPEAGFFGVAPGTSYKTNPNAMETAKRDSIFTNVLLTPEKTVWWEGNGSQPPSEGIDWRGQPWTPQSGEKGAHPNARFTAPAAQCPVISPEWENPQGVPLSAILFGGRRAKLAPLVYESFNWKHGTFVGATMASETTAAATGAVGVVRRDPMAMLPFCGYDMSKYFRHWLDMGKRIPHPPKIFNVNWFKRDDDGEFLWPGYGDNLRALEWIIRRCKGAAEATETPIGYVPTKGSLNLDGLDISDSSVEKLLEVNSGAWVEELEGMQKFFDQFGYNLPEEFIEEQQALKTRLGHWSA
ncbi:MAG: phosphoenolpyruvate carboxykinase (GTP) [Armatimonadetes bacterium]|nr:phosphoenolpyruvate carboxykinase (GTP) [Armatimonadota bacterium]